MRQIGKSIRDVLDPLTAKRANVDLSLSLAWQSVAGEKLAGRTQPLKIQWPPRILPDDPFRPGMLIVASEASAALDLQYQSSELIGRINQFFGYQAVNRIKIEQKPILKFREKQKAVAPQISSSEKADLEGSLAKISDESLRASLYTLGVNVIAGKHAKQTRR